MEFPGESCGEAKGMGAMGEPSESQGIFRNPQRGFLGNTWGNLGGLQTEVLGKAYLGGVQRNRSSGELWGIPGGIVRES